MGRQQKRLFDPWEHVSRLGSEINLPPSYSHHAPDDHKDPVSPVSAGSGPLTDVSDDENQDPAAPSSPGNSRNRTRRLRSSLRSRGGKTDITLVTRGISQYRHGAAAPRAGPVSARSKFSNSSTLRALEGRQRTGVSPISLPSGISPSSGVIGISISPSIGRGLAQDVSPMSPPPPAATALRSAWSPDTPSTAGSLAPPPSSIYSQMTMAPTQSTWAGISSTTAAAFPVSAPPPSHPTRGVDKGKGPQRLDCYPHHHYDDSDNSPFTLFAEDDDIEETPVVSSVSEKSRIATESHYWWADLPHSSSAYQQQHHQQRQQQQHQKQHQQARTEGVSATSTSTAATAEWWKGVDEKRRPSLANRFASNDLDIQHAPIIRVPAPDRVGSPACSVEGSIHATTPVAANSSRAVGNDAGYWVDEPPPYSPGNHGGFAATKFAGTLAPPVGGAGPSSRLEVKRLQAGSVPSPGPISPVFIKAMAGSAGIGMADMSNVPLSPPPPVLLAGVAAAPAAAVPAADPFPDRPVSIFIPQVHAVPDKLDKAERRRRRHEVEDYVALKVGPFRKNGYFGVPGYVGRKRRRWFCVGFLLILALLIGLAAALGSRLHGQRGDDAKLGPAPPSPRRPPPPTTTTTTTTPLPNPTSATDTATPTPTRNIFATASGFPPIPTGVLTVIGPRNAVRDAGCVNPANLWSCSLPKEAHSSVDPFAANRPSVFMQIQWDKSAARTWNVTDPPPPSAGGDDEGGDPGDQSGGAHRHRRRRRRRRRDLSFRTNPEAPQFEEIWFLGNTTDNIRSDKKGGEPTPFYISMISSAAGSVGPNVRRDTDTPTANLAPPDLDDDGTGAPAVLLPTPTQQPLRLFDRGLPTEHYAFYSYFRRTIYAASVDRDDDGGGAKIDEDGGSTEEQAHFLVTWGSVRYRVQIFTQPAAEGRPLLPAGDSIDGSDELTMPGTMPLPVSLSLDLHGGDPDAKFVWHHDVTRPDRTIDATRPTLVPVDMGDKTVNPARPRPNLQVGGVDGGKGGCRCEWVNYVREK